MENLACTGKKVLDRAPSPTNGKFDEHARLWRYSSFVDVLAVKKCLSTTKYYHLTATGLLPRVVLGDSVRLSGQ